MTIETLNVPLDRLVSRLSSSYPYWTVPWSFTGRQADRRSYNKRGAAPGVDGETVASYEQELAQNLQRLHAQIHSGRYRPQPFRRVFIPKADGGQRPLGVTTLEDKIVQGAVAEVLSA